MNVRDAGCQRVKLKPTIDTSAYSVGDVVGGIMTFGTTGLKPFTDCLSGLLKTLTVKEDGTQKAAMTVYFFDTLPTGTYTNNGAFAWGTGDFDRCIAQVAVATADYVTSGSKNIADIDVNKVIQNRVPANLIYAIAVTSGTPTYAATTSLEFQLGIIQD